MIEREIRRFAKVFIKFLNDKPKNRIQALVHIWDRVLVAGWTSLVTITAFYTNNAGILILMLLGVLILIFGLWLVAHQR